MAVDGKRDPAGFVAEFDGGDRFGGHHRVVKKMEAPIMRVGKPDFLFVRRQADPVARAAVAFGGPDFEALHLNPVQHFAAH